MENFSGVMIGRPVERDLVDDGWTLHTARLNNPVVEPDMTGADIAARVEAFDYDVMEEHRARIDQLVADPEVAAMLKPYYRYGCKRPCFHDEYFLAFNNPNVTLVDCPAGVERITAHSAIANDTEYELDCIVYATGFEAELTPFARRAGHTIIGRGGITMEEKWKDGVMSMHGMTTRGFPNMFIMPAPGQQAVTTHNFTHLMILGAEHIAGTIELLEARGVKVFEVITRGGGGLDRHRPQHRPGQQRVHGGLHALAIELRGQPEHVEPAQFGLRRRVRRRLRVP